MAKLPHVNSRRMYSWWWDSHISPKNSRWLQENLTDMDAKVKSMIKLIEEDADSFARRAEMYYKKRPELMKMVEDFYRAYRALAERYDHATGALRQAHKTMTEAFPNQVPSGLNEDELAPDDEFIDDRKGVKQFNDEGKFGGEKIKRGLVFDKVGGKEEKNSDSIVKLEKEIERLKEALAKFEAEKDSSLEKLSRQEDSEKKKAEDEVENLKLALDVLKDEKETSLFEYQKCLERIKEMEGTISSAEKNILDLNEQARKAEAEAQSRMLNLAMMESEKATSLEKILALEKKLVLAEEEALKLKERAKQAETEAESLKKALAELAILKAESEAEVQSLKLELTLMESEKATSTDQFQKLLEKVSSLENKLVLNEEKAKKLRERAEEAETEAKALQRALEELSVERDANAIQYQQCLDTISTLEKNISCAEEEVRMLNGEIESGLVKLKGAEENCILLESSIQSLHFELEALKLKISDQGEELTKKEREMGILWTSIQEERMRFLEAETAFQTLQLLHAQTEQEMKSLALELQNRSLIISDLESCNQSLLNDSLKIKEENKSLNELNFASSVSITNMQNEIISLSETKVKLEEEVELRMDQRNALQQDIYCLKEELNDLNKKYHTLLDEVKDLRDENSNLKVIQERDMREKVDLFGKIENLENVVQKNDILEKSLADLSANLEGAEEEKLALEKSLISLSEEKLILLLEKDVIVTHLLVATENLEKLSEKNTFMENSVSDAHVEIEGLNIRLRSYEESCQILESEKSDLAKEKISLISLVDITRERLEDLEKKYRVLEENCAVVEKQKDSANREVDELRSTVKESIFKEEKQKIEIENLHGKVSEVKNRSVTLEEENSKLVKDFLDLQEKNNSLAAENLLILGETSYFSILSLIFENIINEKSMEIEGLRSNVEKLQVLGFESEDKIILLQGKLEEEHLENVDLKTLLKKTENGLSEITLVNHQLNFELGNANNRLCQMEAEISELKCNVSEIEKDKSELQNIVADLKGEKLKLLHEKMLLAKDFLDLQENNNSLEAENLLILGEMTFFSNLSLIFNTIINEKSLEIEGLRSNVHKLQVLGFETEEKVIVLQGKLEEEHLENVDLKTSLKNTENGLSESTLMNHQLSFELGEAKNLLCQMKAEISELKCKASEIEKEKSELKNIVTDQKEENLKLVHKKMLLVKDFTDLQEKNNSLEAENLLILGETSNLFLILKNIINEKSMEIEGLKSNVEKLQVLVVEFEDKIIVFKGELEEAHLENMDLKKLLKDTETQLNFDIENRKNLLCQMVAEISDVKCKVCEIEKEKSELQGIVADLTEENFETRMLLDEAQRAQNDELALWESEAAYLTSELHTLLVIRASLEEKFKEVIGVVKILKEAIDSKDKGIDFLNEKFSTLEGENGEIRAQLAEYATAFDSLKECVSSLENKTSLHKEIHNGNHDKIEVATENHVNTDQNDTNKLSDLRSLEKRIKAVEEKVIENNIKLEAAMREIHELSSKVASEKENVDQLHVNSVSKNGLLTKDIMLDQISNLNGKEKISSPTKEGILGSGEIVEKKLSIDELAIAKRLPLPNQDLNKTKILERLNSDVQKLTDIQITVLDLKKKIEISEKMIDGSVEDQLVKAEEDIMQLSDLNEKLKKNVDNFDDVKGGLDLDEKRNSRRKFSKQARKFSERIGQLQLDVQKIQFMILKMDVENGKEKTKRKTQVSERKKRTALRNYLGLGTRDKKKKRAFCGCFHPPSTQD